MVCSVESQAVFQARFKPEFRILICREGACSSPHTKSDHRCIKVFKWVHGFPLEPEATKRCFYQFLNCDHKCEVPIIRIPIERALFTHCFSFS